MMFFFAGPLLTIAEQSLASFDRVAAIVQTVRSPLRLRSTHERLSNSGSQPAAIPSSAMMLRSMSNCLFHTARTFTGQFRSASTFRRPLSGTSSLMTTSSLQQRRLISAQTESGLSLQAFLMRSLLSGMYYPLHLIRAIPNP